jgi:hypothetical protein
MAKEKIMIVGTIKAIIRIGLPIAVAVSIANFAWAQSNNPAWTDNFSSQLAVSQQCEVAFFTTIIEKIENGQIHYSARAHCVDGRQFDGQRTGDKGLFVISACDVSVC